MGECHVDSVCRVPTEDQRAAPRTRPRLVGVGVEGGRAQHTKARADRHGREGRAVWRGGKPRAPANFSTVELIGLVWRLEAELVDDGAAGGRMHGYREQQCIVGQLAQPDRWQQVCGKVELQLATDDRGTGHEARLGEIELRSRDAPAHMVPAALASPFPHTTSHRHRADLELRLSHARQSRDLNDRWINSKVAVRDRMVCVDC